MNVKIDTKERFNVLTPLDADISANMTEELRRIGEYAGTAVPHVILNMKNVEVVDAEAVNELAAIQSFFIENDCSFVLCELNPALKAILEKEEMFDVLNIVPSESEAWDMVQMEEMERELLRDDNGEGGGKQSAGHNEND